MDRYHYEMEVLKHLNDENYYTRLNNTPERSIIYEEIKAILLKYNNLYINKSNTIYTFMARYILNLETNKSNLAKFYINLKIHKSPMTGRPICSSIGTVTHNASILLDKWLQPLARKSKFYVQNSIEFIQELENKIYSENCLVVTCDVVNLYPSIVIADGLLQLRRALHLSKKLI